MWRGRTCERGVLVEVAYLWRGCTCKCGVAYFSMWRTCGGGVAYLWRGVLVEMACLWRWSSCGGGVLVDVTWSTCRGGLLVEGAYLAYLAEWLTLPALRYFSLISCPSLRGLGPAALLGGCLCQSLITSNASGLHPSHSTVMRLLYGPPATGT